MSKNVTNADNQQERLKNIGWIIGFTDGEGCFSISIFKNNTTRTGWQIFPEFVVTQSVQSLKSLEIIRNFFQCGSIYINHRKDNHKYDLARYCVRSINDLTETIIPFFNKNPLNTNKMEDFLLFIEVVSLIKKKYHYTKEGIDDIRKLANKMNRRKGRILKNPQRPYAEICT